MSWDCRTVQLRIMVRVHDDSGVDQEKLADWVGQTARDAVDTALRDAEDDGLFAEGVEVELL